MTNATFNAPDFLCVGCMGWGRAKTAREAYRLARSNASPDLIKKEHRKFRIWRLADQVDSVSVDMWGGWTWEPIEGATVGEGAECHRLVWIGDHKAKLTAIPELPTDEITE